MSEVSGPQITFQFKLGLTKDRVTVQDASELNLSSLKSMALQFVAEKFPGHGITRLAERVILFKHDYNSSNILQMVNAVTDIQEDTTVEIVVKVQHLDDEEVEIRPHSLVVHSYKTPTFCHYCGEMLFGMFKQGLKCEYCGLNFHKRCVKYVPNDCTYKKTKRRSSFSLMATSNSLVSSSSVGPASTSTYDMNSTSSGGLTLAVPSPREQRDGSVSPGTSKRERSISMMSGRPPWVDVQMATRLKIPHTFVVHTYTKPTKCHFCGKMLVGVFKQGVQCKDCKYNAHKKCSERVPRDCTGEIPKELLLEMQKGDSGDYDINYVGDDSDDEGGTNGSRGHSPDDTAANPGSNRNVQVSGPTIVSPATFDPDARPTQSNIPVQRLVQSVKQTKRIGSKILKEGWLVHFTNKGSMTRRHYWRLDTKSITLFQNDTGTNYYKEIPLSEILAVESASKRSSSGESSPTTHCFEIRTANVDYFVGEDSTGKSVAGVNNNRIQSGLGSEYAKQWELAIRQALMPVQVSSSGTVTAVLPEVPGAASPSSTQAAPDTRAVKGETTPSHGGASSAAPEPDEKEQDISQAYQIFLDEVLGSGQFGIVYGGVHRKSGHSVAIKVIEKMRFPTKQEAALKNEVSILQNLHHPGVVNLERMFETPERIFVVMEKLKGDMLEMILSSEMGRLSERITRFLVTQILVALKHLHSKNIVHCDLKPENVLLSSDCDFPQVKLCDFGFARIIGEKGFRKSVVGTPAYLAPEVLRNKGYNRSLDMWSTGVIIYVSLSGTFPFNEDEDINEQIQNASFMYPHQTWKDITSQAIDLIGNLLQVKSRKRYSVDKSLMHPWLENYDTYSDLRELEAKCGGHRWLTHESDDIRWENYKRQQAEAGALASSLEKALM